MLVGKIANCFVSGPIGVHDFFGQVMTSEVNSLFYPLGIWSLLYVILSWIIQCAIAIYGNFYASIPQLGLLLRIKL